MKNLILLLKQAEPASFTFWFLTELFFGLFVAALLYFFIVKNPKINKRYHERNQDSDKEMD